MISDPNEEQLHANEEEQLRAALEEQMRNLRVEDLLLQSVASIVNLTARRIAKEDERDLDQARLGIDAVGAVAGLLPDEAARQIRDAVSELRVLYAQAVGAGEQVGSGGVGDVGEAEGGGVEGGGSGGTGGPKPQTPAGERREPEPPPRLWTPGSS